VENNGATMQIFAPNVGLEGLSMNLFLIMANEKYLLSKVGN
jgi:hypothetical protein